MPACGYQTGLAVTVNPDPEDYFATILGSFGVKVNLANEPRDVSSLSSSNDLSRLSKEDNEFVAFCRRSWFTIRTIIRTTTPTTS